MDVRLIDFDDVERFTDAFKDADLAFVCLGTTRAKSGADGFVKVDHDYIVNTAKILKKHGRCKNYHLVSSTGNNLRNAQRIKCIYYHINHIQQAIKQIIIILFYAGASDSSYFLYPLTKGKTEKSIIALGFENTIIYRPGVLLTPEGRQEIRMVEWVLQKLLTVFDLGAHFSIPAKRLAKAMVRLALRDSIQKHTITTSPTDKAVRILENKEIFDLIT